MAYTPPPGKLPALKSRASLEQAMKRRDVNGSELAKLAGTTRATISNLRRGNTSRARDDTARRIEKALGIPRGEVFVDDDDQEELAS
jgi:transcriptional regulator with XRE-family HTH domain